MFLISINKKIQKKNITNKVNLTSDLIIKLKNIEEQICLKRTKNINFIENILKLIIKKDNQNNLFLLYFIKNVLTQYQQNKFLNKIYDYLFKINMMKANIMIKITNCKGKIIFKNTSGMMQFKNKFKIKSIAFSTILKKIKFKIRKIRTFNFSIHILGKIKNKKKTIKKLKNFIIVKSLLNFNLSPFNGCRQKKRKRKKRKRILTIV